MLVNYLAELWGILLVVISLAMLIKQSYLTMLLEDVQDDKKLFCWGVLTLVIGVSMVLAFNVWTWQWQLIITLLGWLTLIKGLALLFMPDFFKNLTKKISMAAFLPYIMIVALIIGLIIAYLGFTA